MPSKKPRQRLQDIVYNIDAIQRYTATCDEHGFIHNPLVIAAVERWLSCISEAAVKLGSDATTFAPDQPWHSIRGLGNHLRHEYDIIHPRDLWVIVRESLPSLRTACEAALDKMGHTSP